MRKPHNTILLLCALLFTNTIALNLPFSINLLETPTSTSSAANLTNSEKLLPHATATTGGRQACYPSDKPVPREAFLDCSQAIWKIPQNLTPVVFNASDFPAYFRYGGCTVTLTLAEQEKGSWWSVDWDATNLWFECQAKHPQTLRGASTYAGIHKRMFVRIWYEGLGNEAEGGVTARELGDDEVERENESNNLSEEG